MTFITGKYYFFALFLFSFFTHSIFGKNTVKIMDLQGHEISSIGENQPFIFEVTIESNHTQEPFFHVFKECSILRKAVYRSNINGRNSTKYSYTLSIKTLGTYNLGPIKVSENNTQEIITVPDIEVIHNKTNNATINKQNQIQKNTNVFMRLYCDKTTLFVGEKTACYLQLYFQNPDIKLKNIGHQTINNVTISEIGSPLIRTKYLNGTEYHYAEWKWFITPNKEGKITIPPYYADYINPEQNSQSNMGLNLLLQLYPSLQRIYSNELEITVHETPLYESKPVDGVGDFTSFIASVSPSVVKTGEALTLTLELFGDACFETIKTPSLQNIPSNIKWYPSTHYIQQSSSEKSLSSSKKFEYIIHGLEAGEFEIPAQKFIFFNPSTQSFQKIKTKSQIITLLSHAVPTSHNPIIKSSYENDSIVKDQNTNDQDNTSIIIPPIMEHWQNNTPLQPISLWLFFIIISIPVLVEIVRPISKMLENKKIKYKKYSTYKNAFKIATKKLFQAQSHNDTQALYKIFIELIHNRCNTHSSKISHDFIEAKIEKLELSVEEKKEWQIFFSEITTHSFGINIHTQENSTLWKKSLHWITLLKKGGL